MRSSSPRRRVQALALGAIAGSALAAPAAGLGAGITLERNPSPPQGITRQMTEQFSFNISFTSNPQRYDYRVIDPLNALVKSEQVGIAGASSPVNASAFYQPAANATVGRYRIELDFLSDAAVPETTATALFDVADALGTLVLQKYEDVNGNARRDATDPGLPNWRFRLVNPQGNPSAAATGPTGDASLPGVPAGAWQVEEIAEPGWVPVSATSGTVQVPPNGTGTFTIGNVRPAPISGVVFIDANRDGVRQVSETGFGEAKLTLTGTTGTGASVRLETRSGDGGAYIFPNLLPGTYAVTIAKPGGWSLTTAQERTGIPLTSGVPSTNHDFGLIRGNLPPGQISENPPELDIDKRGPASALRGRPFTFTLVVRNTSRFVARNVVVTDPIPDTMVLVGTPPGATIENGVVTWRFPRLAANGTRRFTMRVRISPNVPAGRLPNTGFATATGAPPVQDTHRVRISNPVTPQAPPTGGVVG